MKQKPSKVTANEYQGEPRGRKIIPRTGLFYRLSLICFLASENIKQNVCMADSLVLFTPKDPGEVTVLRVVQAITAPVTTVTFCFAHFSMHHS